VSVPSARIRPLLIRPYSESVAEGSTTQQENDSFSEAFLAEECDDPDGLTVFPQ